MKINTDRLCSKKCMKVGETHDFTGPVKVVLEDPPDKEDQWRRLGASFVAMANMMIAANMAIVILYSFSFRENAYYSAHILCCTIGLQFCIPLSILVLHSMHGPSVLMKKSQRRKEHILFTLMGIAFVITGIAVTFFSKRDCSPTVHIYGAYATGVALVISIATGICAQLKQKADEDECVCSKLTTIHRFWGMLALLGSSVTYTLSIGGCRATMQLWLYSIGRDAPLFMIYFVTIFYTLIVLCLPGSKFVHLRVKCDDK